MSKSDVAGIPAGYDPELYRIRHSLAHVMAQAVVAHFPGARVGFGPPIDVGFYYDFELPRPVTDEDLPAIEKRMRGVVNRRVPFTYREVTADEARALFAEQPFKLELIDGITAGGVDEYGNELPLGQRPVLSVYEHDGFVDLCRGPHVDGTAAIRADAFKLTHTAGAYWRGDEKRPMLTRFYATAWKSKAELQDYLHRLEEAKRRDHRKLGRELGLFSNNPLVGAGLPLWLPKGAVIRHQLEQFILELERADGYQHVYTPTLAKRELYEVSGHWDHYKDDMFPVMDMGNDELVLRPMNCPHHILVYKTDRHSYRELPIRIAELGTMFRHERSGVLAGLSRVRCMTLNDAHIFCRPDQIKDEFSRVVRLVEKAYGILGITDYRYRLSLRDPANKAKYVDNDAMWEMGERVLREALDELALPYFEGKGEAAFYGPKLDIQLADVLGREETISTIQLDFHLPAQFELAFLDSDSAAQRPVMIHRAIVSTMERMVAYLIELYAGAFPVWMHPVQVEVVPITDRHVEHCRSLVTRLRGAGFRAQCDDGDLRMNAKVRNAQLQKVPYVAVVGDREMETGTLAVRLRTGQQLEPMSEAAFVEMADRIVRSRSRELT